MIDQMQSINKDLQDKADAFQKAGKDNYDAMAHSYAELCKSIQAIAARGNEYSRGALEEASSAFKKLVGATTLEQATQIQADYAKVAYAKWMAEAEKIGEMYAVAMRDAYKPLEQAAKKKTA